MNIGKNIKIKILKNGKNDINYAQKEYENDTENDK